MAFDPKQVQHLATLASLSLTPEQTATMTTELDAIVKYVEELAAVDVSAVAPTLQVIPEQTEWRDDEPRACLDHDEVLTQAPRAEQGGFAVPVFVEG